MTHLRSLWRTLKTAALTVLCWTAVYGTALARGQPVKEEETGGTNASWIIPYALVVFSIALGMLVVCRSARRRERAKPEDYEGGQLSAEPINPAAK